MVPGGLFDGDCQLSRIECRHAAMAYTLILQPPMTMSSQVMQSEKNQFLHGMTEPVSSGFGFSTGVVTGIKTAASGDVEASGLSLCVVCASGGNHVT